MSLGLRVPEVIFLLAVLPLDLWDSLDCKLFGKGSRSLKQHLSLSTGKLNEETNKDYENEFRECFY